MNNAVFERMRARALQPTTALHRLSDHFRALPRRRQWFAALTVLALSILLFTFGLWLPLQNRLQGLEAALPRLAEQGREAEVLAARLQDRETAGNHKDALELIEQAARTSGVRPYITRIKPQVGLGGRVLMLRMHRVPYAPLVRFLSRLAHGGLVLARARLLASSKPGLLEAEFLILR